MLVLREDLPNVGGLFVWMEGKPVIIVDAKLRGRERVGTSFHELAHYFMHSDAPASQDSKIVGLSSEFAVNIDNRREVEANTSACIALAPKTFARQFYRFTFRDIKKGGEHR